MELRDYQIKVIREAESHLNDSGKVLIVSPTGSGKTFTTCSLLNDYNHDGVTLILTHRTGITKQFYNVFKKLTNLTCSYVSSSKHQLKTKYLFMNIQSAIRRVNELKMYGVDFILIDEAHVSGSKSYKDLIKKISPRKLLGLTATPERTDKQCLRSIFSNIVYSASIARLIGDRHLSKYKYFASQNSTNVDDKQIKSSAGDFQARSGGDAYTNAMILADITDILSEHDEHDSPILVFASTVFHAEKIMAFLETTNIKCGVLHSKMSKQEQSDMLNEFENKKIKALITIGMAIEGLDYPFIKIVVLLTPTKSSTKYYQAIGRGMRPYENQDLIIIDGAGNYKRHDEPILYDPKSIIDGKEEKKKDKKLGDGEFHHEVILCENCSSIMRQKFVCDECGHEDSALKERMINLSYHKELMNPNFPKNLYAEGQSLLEKYSAAFLISKINGNKFNDKVWSSLMKNDDIKINKYDKFTICMLIGSSVNPNILLKWHAENAKDPLSISNIQNVLDRIYKLIVVTINHYRNDNQQQYNRKWAYVQSGACIKSIEARMDSESPLVTKKTNAFAKINGLSVSGGVCSIDAIQSKFSFRVKEFERIKLLVEEDVQDIRHDLFLCNYTSNIFQVMV